MPDARTGGPCCNVGLHPRMTAESGPCCYCCVHDYSPEDRATKEVPCHA